ncbi:hypothetical protein HAX54_036348 [Datura stramonium]|uniref:Uncharacterized protein n=1 Tax=Datura stramonium TaxID=4076 RepID=A0ABS8VJS3_DATST|nr:hypothetical protein [Datura stramonium]
MNTSCDGSSGHIRCLLPLALVSESVDFVEPVSKTAASDLTAFMLLHPMNRKQVIATQEENMGTICMPGRRKECRSIQPLVFLYYWVNAGEDLSLWFYLWVYTTILCAL